MRHVLIDASGLLFLLKKKRQLTGVNRVNLAYLMSYQERLQLVFYWKRFKTFVVMPPHISKKIINLMTPWSFSTYQEIRRCIIKYGLLYLFKKRQNFSTYFFIKLCSSGLKSSAYFLALKELNAPLIAMVHDLIPIETSELYLSKQVNNYKNYIDKLIEHSTAIITVSQTEHSKFIKYLKAKGIVNFPTTASGLASGLSKDIIIDATRPLNDPYFVIIGSTSATRKNHLLLLEIWLTLAERLGNKTPKLVILGKIKTIRSPKLAAIFREKKLQNLIILREVNDSELAHYLAYAQALLLPSSAEGYGLPLVEAFSYNTPVIANTLPVFREIANDVPDYIAVTDKEKWLRYITDYSKADSVLRLQQLERIKNFKPPTWQEHFERVNQFLENLG